MDAFGTDEYMRSLIYSDTTDEQIGELVSEMRDTFETNCGLHELVDFDGELKERQAHLLDWYEENVQECTWTLDHPYELDEWARESLDGAEALTSDALKTWLMERARAEVEAWAIDVYEKEVAERERVTYETMQWMRDELAEEERELLAEEERQDREDAQAYIRETWGVSITDDELEQLGDLDNEAYVDAIKAIGRRQALAA